jgi:hypothetical protein
MGMAPALHQSLFAELSTYNVHLGIIYLGFTENDLIKTLSADGTQIPVLHALNLYSYRSGVQRTPFKDDI